MKTRFAAQMGEDPVYAIARIVSDYSFRLRKLARWKQRVWIVRKEEERERKREKEERGGER